MSLSLPHYFVIAHGPTASLHMLPTPTDHVSSESHGPISLTPVHVGYLRVRAVYLTMDGRISMAGLSASKCPYLADAIADALAKVKA